MSNGDIRGGTLYVNVTERAEEVPYNWFGNMYGYGSEGGIQSTPSEVEKDYEFADFTWGDPLVVDVYAGTPEPSMMALPEMSPEAVPAVFVEPTAMIGPPGEVPFDPRLLFGGGYPADLPPAPLMSTPELRPGGASVNGYEFQGSVPGIEFPSLRGLLEPFAQAGLQYIARRGVQRGPAPRAELFGGECPPGRVLRKVRLGRDICAKKPRMNVCNPKALARASRRVAGYLTLSKKTAATMRQSFAPILRTPKARSSKGGGCVACGARSRSACIC